MLKNVMQIEVKQKCWRNKFRCAIPAIRNELMARQVPVRYPTENSKSVKPDTKLYSLGLSVVNNKGSLLKI